MRGRFQSGFIICNFNFLFEKHLKAQVDKEALEYLEVKTTDLDVPSSFNVGKNLIVYS